MNYVGAKFGPEQDGIEVPTVCALVPSAVSPRPATYKLRSFSAFIAKHDFQLTNHPSPRAPLGTVTRVELLLTYRKQKVALPPTRNLGSPSNLRQLIAGKFARSGRIPS
jgi:hypothetical protein